MWVRVSRGLPFAAQHCYERFCSVVELPQWVPTILSAQVRTRHADGSVEEVEFSRRDPSGDVTQYTLAYSFDATKRRVAWQPREERPNGVRGYAVFEAAPEGCKVTYALDHGSAFGTDREQHQRLANQALDAFQAWLEGKRPSKFPRSISTGVPRGTSR